MHPSPAHAFLLGLLLWGCGGDDVSFSSAQPGAGTAGKTSTGGSAGSAAAGAEQGAGAAGQQAAGSPASGAAGKAGSAGSGSKSGSGGEGGAGGKGGSEGGTGGTSGAGGSGSKAGSDGKGGTGGAGAGAGGAGGAGEAGASGGSQGGQGGGGGSGGGGSPAAGAVLGSWIFGDFVHVSVPAVGANGTLYVSFTSVGLQAGVMAFDPAHLETPLWKWSIDTNLSLFWSPVVDLERDRVYVCGYATGLMSFEASTGKPLWNLPDADPATQTGRCAAPPALGHDGTVYFPTADSGVNKLFAVNPDGTFRWNVTLDQGVPVYGDLPGVVVGADGTIYTNIYFDNQPPENDVVVAVHPDGTVLWTTKATGSRQASPVLGADGMVYLQGTRDVGDGSSFVGAVHALQPNGVSYWTRLAPYPARITLDRERRLAITGDSSLGGFQVLAPDGSKLSEVAGYYLGEAAVDRDGRLYTARQTAEDPQRTVQVFDAGGAALGAFDGVRTVVSTPTLLPGMIVVLHYASESSPALSLTAFAAPDLAGPLETTFSAQRGDNQRTGRAHVEACAGVLCNAPPADSCQDPDTVLAYERSGTCEPAGCAYKAHTRPCTRGCKDGACLPWCEDQDGDGYGEGPGCKGRDCDDSNPKRSSTCWIDNLFPKPWPATAQLTGKLTRDEHHCTVNTKAGLCELDGCYDEVATIDAQITLHIAADETLTVDPLPISVCIGSAIGAPETLGLGSFSFNLNKDPFAQCMKEPITFFGDFFTLNSDLLTIHETCFVDYGYGNNQTASAVFKLSFVADPSP